MNHLFRPFRLLAGCAVIAMAAHASPAEAAGVVIDDAALSLKTRTSLAKDIAAYKVKNPRIFEQVRDVKGHRPEQYKKFRNPVPLAGRELKRLGPEALLPMLEALAFEAPPTDGLKENEVEALRVGLLEAVGYIRDQRSDEVLGAVFASKGSQRVLTAAAEAMGRYCSDAGYKSLSKATNGSKRVAAISGLGQCRTETSARLLVSMFDAARDAEESRIIAEALGVVGSDFGWRALARKEGKHRLAEGLRIRSMIAEALVRHHGRFGAKAQTASRESLLMVQAPSTRSAVSRNASRLSASARAELERVAARIERRLKR